MTKFCNRGISNLSASAQSLNRAKSSASASQLINFVEGWELALTGDTLLTDATFGVEELFESAMLADDLKFGRRAESEMRNAFDGGDVDLRRLDWGRWVRINNSQQLAEQE